MSRQDSKCLIHFIVLKPRFIAIKINIHAFVQMNNSCVRESKENLCCFVKLFIHDILQPVVVWPVSITAY